MWHIWLLPAIIVGTAALLSIPVGRYLAWVIDADQRRPRVFAWVEGRLDTGPQSWKQYAIALLLFNTVMFVFTYIVLSLQPVLPLNPTGEDHKGMLAPTTIFNTACSFVTN